MFRLVRKLPFFRLLAVAQTILLARRHFRHLSRADRQRLTELARKGRGLDAAERDELRALMAKMEPKAFAMAAADRFSPVSLRRWMR